MPVIGRKQFAELVGRTELAINLDVSRLKISHLVGNKKLIDTEDPLNAEYIAKWKSKSSGIVPVKPAKEKPPKPVKQPKIAENPVKVFKIKEKKPEKAVKIPVSAAVPKSIRVMQEAQTLVNNKRVDQDFKKKELEIANLELAKQQKELLLQKSAGQLLPVDLTRGIIERNANSIFKSFEQGLDRIAAIYCNIMAGGDRKMMGQIVTQGKAILGECIAEAGKLTAEEISILVTDFSQQLMRGQRKA